MKVTWCVEVSYEDDDPATFGPYTEAQAERVAARLQGEAELADAGDGVCRHPRNVRSAYAVPMSRYEQFLTAEERREVRREVSAVRRERRP